MRTWLPALLLCCVGAGCGDSVDPLPPVDPSTPPQNIRALSVNDTTVQVVWEKPAGIDEVTIRRYLIEWNGHSDSVTYPASSYHAVLTPASQAMFIVRGRLQSGGVSNPASIAWAPASRFDTPVTLLEYSTAEPLRISAIDFGNRTLDPSADSMATGTQPRVDAYLYAASAQQLELRSTHLFLGTWNTTAFSTTTAAGTSLDVPMSSFPPPISFTQSSVVLTDDRIYFARVTGSAGETHIVRFHVRLGSAAAPNRTASIRVSLQRKPGVIFACSMDSEERAAA